MALINCPECNKEVSDIANACPNCGYPINKNIEKSNNNVFYQKPTEKLPKEKKKGNCLITTIKIIGGIIAFFVIISFFSSDTSSDDNKEKTPQDYDSYEEYAESQKIVSNESDIFKEELDIYNSGEYHFILPEDLNKYHSNLVGLKFYTVITIDDIKDGVIQSSISDGYMMSNFTPISDYTEKVAVDDIVSIMGVVDSNYNDYGSIGKSLEFIDCYIFAKGNDAELYRLEKTDAFFNDYFVVTEEVANSNKDISEEEYKALCNVLEYNDILRNPDSYNGVYCKLNGTVSQIIEGWLGSYSIFVSDSNGNKWGCVYNYSENESHLLEGDYVTFYGKCNGTTTTDTVLGKQVTLPYIDVKYIK